MKKRIVILTTLMLLSVASLWARPGYSKPVDVLQPDGTTITLLMRGDEFLSFMTTIDGYTVVKDSDGYYRYAEKQNGGLKATAVVAHNPEARNAAELTFLTGTKKRICPDMSEEGKKMKAMASAMHLDYQQIAAASGSRRARPSIWPLIDYNNFKGLVILVNWNDRQFTMNNPQEFYQKLTSEKNYRDDSRTIYPVPVTGSTRDYFYDNSLGKFDPTFDVVGPVTIEYSCTYPQPKTQDKTTVADGYIGRLNNVFKEVMSKANELVDFSQYDLNNDGNIDMVYFIFAGYGSYVGSNDYKYMWPHAQDYSQKAYNWGTTTQADWYGFPQYDGKKFGRYACSVEIQDEENKASQHVWLDGIGTMCHEFSHVLGLADHYDTANGGDGTGLWDVMAAGADYNYGLTPVGYNAFERYMLNFADERMLTEDGDYTLNPFDTSNEYYKLATGSTSDDFFLENRQKQGWDTYLPGHGLLVWRADTSRPSVWTNNTVNNDASHNYFEILGAFPGSNNTIDLTPTSTPALLSWAQKEAKQDLYDIKEENGIVTFKAGKGVYDTCIEDFEATPITDADATGVAGKYCNWNLTNAVIEATTTGGKGNGQHVAKLLRNGKLTSSALTSGVRSLRFTVQNGAQKIRFSLKYSTNGTNWTTLVNSATINANKDESYFFLDIPTGSQLQFSMLSTSNSAACYLDDLEMTFVDNIPSKPETSGIEAVLSTTTTNGRTYNLSGQRVADSYKGLVIKNGKKVVIK